jgi:hypothetical protein
MIQFDDKTVILASYYSQDYEEPVIYLVQGATVEELIQILDQEKGEDVFSGIDEFIKDDYISPTPEELANYIESKGYKVIKAPVVGVSTYADYTAGKYEPTIEWGRDK